MCTSRASDAYLVSRGGPPLLLQQTHGDAQLLRAIRQHLHVVEVAREPDAAEDGLLEPQVEVVQHPIHRHSSNLVAHATSLGLQPENVRLVALQNGQQLVELKRRAELAVDARPHHAVSTALDNAHLAESSSLSRMAPFEKIFDQ